MTRINKLTQNPELFADDLLVIWDEDNQRTRSITAQTLEKFTDATGVNAKAFVDGYIRDGILYMTRANGEVATIGDVDNININVQEDELVTYDPGTKEFIGTGVFAKDGEVTATTNTFNLGGAWAISSSGDLVALTNKSKGKSYTVKMGSFSKLGNPEELVNRELVTNFNPNTVFTDEITNLVFPNIPITPINQSQPENGHIAEFLDFRLGPNSVKTNIKIDTYIGDVLFDSTTFETATEVEPGIFRFHFKTPIVYAVGDIIRTETTSTDGNVTMMGDLSTMRAWLRFDATLFDVKQIGLKDKDVKEVQGNFSNDELTTKLILNDDSEIESSVDIDTGVQSVVAGNKILVDDSDPKNPIVSWNPSGDLLPGVNIDKEGVQVLSAADTLNFGSTFNVTKAKDTGGTVNIELSTAARGTNEVGVFESTTDLLAAYPTPEDGLYARVLQGNNNYPDDRYESKGGNWIGMGGVAGQVIVDDNKSIGLIMGDGLKSEDDGGSSRISINGNTPVLTFDVTTDSTRVVDDSYVGKFINIIQTPPSISIPMQITLSDHSQFKTGDTIKIAADRDGDDAYNNYYFAVYFNDSKGRQIAKYPANNITMVRTDTAWDVQLDGRFTNVSIRPKAAFNIPYEPDEQYNTPVNAFVFADSPAVEFEVDEDTNTRIVKVDLDSVTDNYITKYSRADTDYVQVAYQGKYGDERVYHPASINQDSNGYTFCKFTGYMEFVPRNKSTGNDGSSVLELREDRVVNKKQPYYNDKKLAVQESDVEFTKLQVQRSGRDYPPVSIFVDGYMNTIMEANGEFKFRYLDAGGSTTQTLQASTSKWNFLVRPKYNNVNLVTNNEVYDIINDAIEPGSGISANSIRVARVTGYTNNYTSISYTDDKIEGFKFGKDNSFFEMICYANSKLAYIMIHKDNVSASIGREVDDGDLTLGVNTSSDAKVSIGKYGQNLPTPVDDGVVAKMSYNYYAMTMKLDNANQDANDPTQFLKSDGTITTNINEAQRMGYTPMGLTLNQSFNGRDWGHSLIRGYIKSDKTFEVDITSPYYVMAVTIGSSLTLTKQHTAGMNVGSLIFYNNPLDASLDQNPLARIDDVNENENIVYQQQFKGKSGYDALISGGGSTKTVTYGDNGKILKISNATVKVELLQGMNSDTKPHGYFKYINSHNADVAFEWYDRAGNRISNNVPSVCPKDTVVEVFADYAKDEYVLNFSQSKVISSVSEEKVQQIVSKSFDSLLEPGEGTQPFSKHPLPNPQGYLSTYSSVMYDEDDRLVVPRNAYDRTLFELFFEASKSTAYCTISIATVELLLGRILQPEDIELGIALEQSTAITPGLYSATTPSNVPSTWAWNGKFIPLTTEGGEHNDPNNPSVWLSQDGDYVYTESEAGNKPKYDQMSIGDLMVKDGQTWRYALRRGYIMKDGSFVFDAESPYYAFVIKISGYQTPQSKIHTVFFNSGGIKLYPDAISAYMSANKLADGLGTIINEMVTDGDLSDVQIPKAQSFINESTVNVDYPTSASGNQYRPQNVVVTVLDTDNLISELNINVTSSDIYSGHYNSVGSISIDSSGQWSTESRRNAYRLDDGTNTYCVYSDSLNAWVLIVADVDHNHTGSSTGGVPVNLYNDGQLPESHGDYSIENNLDSIDSEYFTQADVDIDYHTNSDGNSYFVVKFGNAKPAGIVFYK